MGIKLTILFVQTYIVQTLQGYNTYLVCALSKHSANEMLIEIITKSYTQG
jgi:hypothetical protein